MCKVAKHNQKHKGICITVSWAAVVLMALAIFWISSKSGNDVNTGLGLLTFVKGALASAATALFGHDVDVSPVGHFVEYLVFGALLFNALAHHVETRKAVLLALFLGSLYGISDELHQYLVPDRSCDPLDWVVDTVATFLGAYAARCVWEPKSSPEPTEPKRS